MLDRARIEQAMVTAGLDQAAIAAHCDVPLEVVGRWLAGESVPRPSKLTLLATALAIPVPELFLSRLSSGIALVGTDESVAATMREARAAIEDIGWRLHDLSGFLSSSEVFERAKLAAPATDLAYLQQACAATKLSLGLRADAVLGLYELLRLARAAGVQLAPMPWLGDRAGQSQELHVGLRSQETLWLVFGYKTTCGALSSSLAFALGLAYGRNLADEGEKHEFARAFARVLAPADLDNKTSVEDKFFGGVDRSFSAFVKASENNFGSPLYSAIREYQRYAGGRDPAFVAAALNVGLADAVQLTFVLSDVCQDGPLPAGEEA